MPYKRKYLTCLIKDYIKHALTSSVCKPLKKAQFAHDLMQGLILVKVYIIFIKRIYFMVFIIFNQPTERHYF